MIYTITLNPAIDKAVVIHNFRVDEVNRITNIQQDPGGKGINVSNMVKQLNGQSVAVLLAAGHNGETLVDMLDDRGIDYQAIPCMGETRINVKVFDPTLKTYTDLNEPGPDVDGTSLEAVAVFLEEHLEMADILVLAGSIHASVPKDIYKDLILRAKAKGARVVLDASGDALKASIAGAPFMIKPNQEELEAYFNVSMKDDGDVALYARKLLEFGIQYVVVSQGEHGCLVISKDQVAKLSAVRVVVKSTVGAGDAMVGGIVKSLADIKEPSSLVVFDTMVSAVRYGVAASSASIEQPGTIMGSLDRVEVLYRQIEVDIW